MASGAAGTAGGGPPRPAGPGAPRVRRATAGLATAALVASGPGCAKEEAPPGALPDQRPPEVREIVPPPGSVVPDFEGDVRVRLDEPVQFSGSYGRDLEASPAYRYRVSTGFSDIRVRPEEGWRRGAVYVLRLPGGFRDLLGNEREAPIEVVFSTGPELTETRVSGRLRDRLTGEGVRGARILALAREGDSIPYTTVSDTGGAFSLRFLPPDDYTVYAFEDLNRNLSLERLLEPHDSATVRLEEAGATAELDLGLVPPDSTPPVLVEAGAADSLTVVLSFDDPLDPEQDLSGADVSVRPSGEPTPLPLERVDLERSPPADVEADVEADAEADAEAPPGDTVPLPSDSLFLRLGRPLEAGRSYRATATGLVNLRGLAGGGDTTFVYEPADTVGEGDGAGAAPPDSAADGASAPDTARAGEEGASPDTAQGKGDP